MTPDDLVADRGVTAIYRLSLSGVCLLCRDRAVGWSAYGHKFAFPPESGGFTAIGVLTTASTAENQVGSESGFVWLGARPFPAG